jgi:hypothetical protein
MEIPFSLFTDTYKLLMGFINTGEIFAEFVAELMYLKVASIVSILQNSEIREVMIRKRVFAWQNSSCL